MKLDIAEAILSLLEAGGKWDEKEEGYTACNWNGLLHRDDGPALVYPDGKQYWYRNGRLHRDDGPAVVYPNGTQYWYCNGEQYMP